MNERKKNIPRLASAILRRLIPSKDYMFLVSYFEDIYANHSRSRGWISAGLKLWSEIFKSLPGFIWNTLYWRISMFKNTLTIALRNIKKYKIYAGINLAGLSLGMVVCMLIYLWVQDETRYDRFHSQGDRIVQVYSQLFFDNNQNQIFMGSYYPMAKVLSEEIPEVIQATRYKAAQDILIQNGNRRFTNDTIGLADPSFFTIFSFPFLKGTPETAFADKFSAVITERMARKYFGNEDPMGKILTVAGDMDIQVTGIISDPPSHSSLQFDCIVPFVLQFGPNFSEPEHWGGNPLETYALLSKNPDFKSIAHKITSTVESHNKRETSKEVFHLHPLYKKHLHSPAGASLIDSIFIFSTVAFSILLIACINFMNLSTAQAGTRAREVGLRKVVGACKSDLVRQFVGESMVITLITLVIAIFLLWLCLPAFNRLLGKQFSLILLLKPKVFLGFLIIALFTGLFAGSYPAFYLSSFQPVHILKKLFPTGLKSATMRKILVLVQFSLSIFMIITMAITYKQLQYIQNMDLGFERNNLLALNIPSGVKNQYSAFRTELLAHPGIVSVSRSLQGPWNISSTVSALDWDGKPLEESINMNWDYVGYGYFETMGLEIIEGRTFSKDHPTDLSSAYLVNEEAVKLMGMGMENAVGKRLSVFRNEGTIIGIVKNFHFQPIYHEIRPFVFILKPESSSYALVRIGPDNHSEILAHIKTVYESFEKNLPFNPMLFNEVLIGYIYRSQIQTVKIAGYFTFLAIVISSLGLFGLAAFMAEKRTKELGVRKVLGASETNLIMMLSRDFTKWVIIANVFAWPAAFFVLKQMLGAYAYKVEIGLEIFIFSGLAALIIALAAVSYHTVHAARKNPAHSLRYE